MAEKTTPESQAVSFDGRIQRLEEALVIIRGMWTDEKTSFAGKHYRTEAAQRAANLPEGSAPSILIGGGGPRLLRLAGRYADIVGISAMVDQGKLAWDDKLVDHLDGFRLFDAYSTGEAESTMPGDELPAVVTDETTNPEVHTVMKPTIPPDDSTEETTPTQ